MIRHQILVVKIPQISRENHDNFARDVIGEISKSPVGE